MTFKIRQKDSVAYFDAQAGYGLVDMSLQAGAALPHGCGHGQCGNCTVQVVSGDYQYLHGYRPDALLTPQQQAQGWVISCMIEATSDLVLNVPHGKKKLPAAGPARVRVIDKSLLSENVLKLTVKVACDKPFYFLPGQYIDFILDDGEKRAYSIASIPNANSQLELHVRYVPGGRFSELAFNRLDVGATLQIEAPKGRFFWHDERRNPIIMVAGGTGFAPIKAMIEALVNSHPHQKIHLYWGVSNTQDFYAHHTIEQWRSSLAALTYTPVLFKTADDWPGRSGSVVEAVVTDHPNLSDFDVYVAGPPEMVKQGIDVFPAFGLPENQLFTDAFNYAHDQKRKAGILRKIGRLFSRKEKSAPKEVSGVLV